MKYVRQGVHFLNQHLERVMIVVLTSVLVLCLIYSSFVRYFVTMPFFTSLDAQGRGTGDLFLHLVVVLGRLPGNQGKCAFPHSRPIRVLAGTVAAVAILAGRLDLARIQWLRRMAGLDSDPVGHRQPGVQPVSGNSHGDHLRRHTADISDDHGAHAPELPGPQRYSVAGTFIGSPFALTRQGSGPVVRRR